MSLDTAWDKYTGSCTCGKAQSNNCAHYLTNALIEAGYTALDQGKGADQRQRGGFCVCPDGRPVRALEVRNVFFRAGNRTPVKTRSPGVIYAIYQERARDGQGHVLLMKDNEYRGTGNYPSWEKQEYYQF